MKKIMIILFSFYMIFYMNVFANRQHVHQRLTIEGYNLLKKWVGNQDITAIQQKLGGYTDIGSGPWQLGFLTTGAWREDCEDIVYNIWQQNPPIICGFTATLGSALGNTGILGEQNDGFVSTTHFWYADNGDDIATDMYGAINILGINNTFQFTIPNAYQKIRELAYGKHLVYQKYVREVPLPSGYLSTLMSCAKITFRFNIIDLFKGGNLYVSEIATTNGDQYLYDQPFTFRANMWSDLNTSSFEDFKQILIWETLGRMCHLLQDMCVPAHANIDPHGGSGLGYDSFEIAYGDIGWTADMVFNQKPQILNPFVSSNPLHFLMYTLNQQANHFASNGPHMSQNNNYFGGNALPEEISYLNNLNVANYGLPTSMQENIPSDQVQNMNNKLFPEAIRSTAALLYWFGRETNLIPMLVPQEFPTIAGALAMATSGKTITVTGEQNITSNLVIPSGITLDLKSNSTLNFNSGTNLTINGKLLANGVTFKGLNGTYWKGIKFINSNSGSSINYSTIKNFGTGLGTDGIYIEGCSPWIENNTIGPGQYNGIKVYNGSPRIINNTISNLSSGNGITIESQSQATVQGNTISNTYYHGISIYNCPGTNNINGNIISQIPNYHGIRLYGSYADLSRNQIFNCNYGFYSENQSTISCAYNMQKNNLIKNCSYGMVAYNSSFIYGGSSNPSPYYYENYNSIPYDLITNKILNASNSSTIQFINNWLGTLNYSIIGAKVNKDVSSSISWQPVLDWDPWQYGAAQSQSNLLASSVNMQNSATEDEDDELLNAYRLINAQDFISAKEIIKNLLGKGSKKAPTLLVLFDFKTNDKDILDYAESYSLKNIDYVQEKFLNSALSKVYFNRGDFSKSEKFIDKLISKGNKEAKIDKFLVNALGYRDNKKAFALLNDIEKDLGKEKADELYTLLLPDITTIPGSNALVKSDVENIINENVQEGFVSDNYPNPFNPTTTISFNLPTDGRVAIKVYDIMGREVVTLLDEERTNGLHSVVWNSKNKYGSDVASGIYFYNITFKDKSLTKKIMLMK